jgi:hypothetical protein
VDGGARAAGDGARGATAPGTPATSAPKTGNPTPGTPQPDPPPVADRITVSGCLKLAPGAGAAPASAQTTPASDRFVLDGAKKGRERAT